MKSEVRKIELSKRLQEESYQIPYHYLVTINPKDNSNFSQCKNNPGGYRYAGYILKMLNELEKETFDSLVDIGCGDGYFVGKVCEKFRDKEIVGIDISKNAIEYAKIINKNKAVYFLQMDITKNNIERKFDIVTLIEVLEHIPPKDINNFLKSIYGLLNDNGKLIITVPSKNLPIKNIKRHFQHFDEQSLVDTLSDYFVIDKIQYINSMKFYTKIIHKIFTNSLFILNNEKIKNRLFSLYLKKYLNSDKKHGLRIFAVCKKKKI